MAHPPTVSVVIVTYFTGPSLWICLNRLGQLQGVHEIIVINNGNDAAVEKRLEGMAKAGSNFHLVSGQGNVGFAKACNMGAEQASGEYILLLNPDAVVLEDHALLRMANLLADSSLQPQPWLVGGILRDEWGREQRASRRNLMTPKNALSEGLGLCDLFPDQFPRINITTPQPQKPEWVPAVSGACMMLRTDKYRELGGLDNRYFLHVEDMDLCARVAEAGGSVWIHPDANILHYTSTSQTSSLFLERCKTNGFHTYFATHFRTHYFWRYLASSAAALRLGWKALDSLTAEWFPQPVLDSPYGVRQVQAILRGMQASSEEGMSGQGVGTAVMVTGGSTAVGLFAIGRLLGMGCKVVAICHKSHIGFFHDNLVWIHADLRNPRTLHPFIDNHPCHYLLHTAPIWLLPQVIPSLRQVGVERVSAVSSTSLMGKARSKDLPEQKTVEQLQQGELALAEQCAALDMQWTILRPTMIYGAGLDANVTRIARVIETWRMFPVQPPAEGKRAPVHADDVALAALRALVQPAATGQTYHISGGTVMPFHELPERIADVMGISLRIPRIKGLATLLGWLRRIGIAAPSPEIARRMQRDLVFPDDRVKTELLVSAREFLESGRLDLGETDDTLCQYCLPELPDS